MSTPYRYRWGRRKRWVWTGLFDYLPDLKMGKVYELRDSLGFIWDTQTRYR